MSGGESKNDGQDRAHARGPTESESEANHKRAPRGAATFHAVQARIGVESFDLEYSGQVQAEENNNYARDLRQGRAVARQHLADFGRDRSQSNEDDAESENEGDRVQHDFPQ